MAREQVTMKPVDMDSLTQAQQDAWAMYLEAKSALGEALNASAPQGKRIIFSAKYNVLKVALVSKAQNKEKAQTVSLSDWQNGQASDGRAV